jgi:serine/threonine-protein kinase
MLGRVLDDRYRIESLIGRGGMGAVYRGVQLATKQVVAIKVVRAEQAEDTEAAKRFHREARAASLLRHPHTIRVFDFGESDEGDLFMVLEFLDGDTLAKARRVAGRFGEGRIARIACEVSQSLMEAHAAGLAHRDLKPENIMLLNTPGHPDFVKVLDFGIAKILTGSSGESSVTRAGMIVGTPHYMAPEQAYGGQRASPAVDVYALGVTVFEALAGVKPFDGDTPMAILTAHTRLPAPEMPAALPVSDRMRDLVRRMLAKEPGLRPTAADLVIAFDSIRSAAPPEPVAPTGPIDPVSEPETPTLDLFAEPPVLPEPPPPSPAPGPAAPPPTRVTLTDPVPEPAGPVAAKPASRAGGSRWLPWLVAGAALPIAAISLAILILSGPRDPGSPASPPPGATAAPDPGPAVFVPPAADPRPVERPSLPAAPARYLVRFDSDPPGARVFEDERELGTTPIALDVSGPPGPRTFRFRLDRYADTVVTAEVKAGAVIGARLEPLAARDGPGRARPARPGGASPSKRKDFVPVD